MVTDSLAHFIKKLDGQLAPSSNLIFGWHARRGSCACRPQFGWDIPNELHCGLNWQVVMRLGRIREVPAAVQVLGGEKSVISQRGVMMRSDYSAVSNKNT